MFNRSRRLVSVFVLCIQLTFGGGILLTQTSCGEMERAEALAYTEEAIETAKELLPVFAAAGLSSTHVNRGVQIGSDLVVAFRENKDAKALELVSKFIDVIDKDIFSDVNLIKDQTNRTIAMAVLAGVRITLRRVSKFLKPAEESGMMGAKVGSQSDKAKVRAFAKSKDWRCRNATTGRFEKMEFCKQNPARSVVEVY